MAEAFNSLFKAECIRNPVMKPKHGWRSVGDVEIAVAVADRGDAGSGVAPNALDPANAERLWDVSMRLIRS